MTPSQADNLHLTLVSNSRPAAQLPADAFEPMAFLQSVTASLELEEVIEALSQHLAKLFEHSGWNYCNTLLDIELSGGNVDRHRVEYALNLHGQDLGTLKLMRGRRFREEEQLRIESLLGLAAPAIQNAILFRDVTRQLERDPLTGLGNRRALTLQGVQWLSDSLRRRQPVSMLALDLDRFKAVNDTHGHQSGDRLLRAVAATLESVTRAGDLCVRMGGDEFVVLLPGADLALALECGERIRRALAAASVETDAGATIRARASIGVATHRPDMDLEQLHRQADEALYAAKRAGSDCVLARSSVCDA